MIYLKTKKTFLTVHELLKELYSGGIRSYGSSWPQAIVTYKDNTNNSDIQCYQNKIRSFDDLKELILTYFPNLTLEEIVHEIITLDLSNDKQKFYFYPSSCSTIRLITIYYMDRKKDTVHHLEAIPHYSSRYSWKELLALLKINNIYQLYDYIDKHKIKEVSKEKVEVIKEAQTIAVQKKENRNYDSYYLDYYYPRAIHSNKIVKTN